MITFNVVMGAVYWNIKYVMVSLSALMEQMNATVVSTT